MRFRWNADGHVVECLVELSQGPSQPREAGYALDDRWGHRLVRTEDYAQFLASGARLVDLPDPLPQLVADFVSACRDPSADAVPSARIVPRLAAVRALADAFLEQDRR